MRIEEHDWQYGRSHKQIEFKSLPKWWDLVNSKVKTAEVRLLTSGESRKVERAAIGFIKLTHSQNGNTLCMPLSWYGKVGEFLGISVWEFCWDPKDVK